jgi:hypothetical protein
MSWIGWGLLVVAGVVSVPCLIVAAECFLALLPLPKHRSGERGKVAVLIPAHNEQLLIGQTLQRLLPQITAVDRVLVVADNCTDKTALMARSHGVEVLERHDTQNRGKGFALAAGVAHLAADPPDVVIVFDADCDAANSHSFEAVPLGAAPAGRRQGSDAGGDAGGGKGRLNLLYSWKTHGPQRGVLACHWQE